MSIQKKIVDFLIIGAGSSGCVIANRLSAFPSQSVALVEYGPKDDSNLIKIPAGAIFLLN